MTPDPTSEARRLLQSYLARRQAGEDLSFEAFCAEHPHLSAELRRLWLEEEVSPEFTFFLDRLLGGAAPSRSERLRAGERFGDYRLVELLASGGQGEVWVAEQLSLRRLVALKFILPERVSVLSRALFAREARAGGRLSHPGIVAVYDHGETDGHAWIAMELVEGACTLRNSIDEVLKGGELPRGYYRRVAALVAQVADALQAAHEAGVIHRDIKPSNILVTRDDRPKLTDFGLARIVDEAALSKTGDFAGTYAYMSPEQVAARRAGIDHRTDVFSLGVVTYELLSLQRPFTGDSSHQIAEQILTVDPPDLHRVSARIPRDLAVICAKALAKARGERFQSMAELAAELRRFLAGEPILTRPPSVTRRLARWTRRHPLGLAVGASAAATALALGLVTRRPPPGPFADHEVRQVTDTPADDRSPTFLGERALVFERREGDASSLWIVDLGGSLTPRPWSPAGQAFAAPSASPDGRWLAYEVPAGTAADAGARTAIELRRLEGVASGPPWPAQVEQRLELEGSVGGARWSRDSRLVYTHVLGDQAFLMLHDAAAPARAAVELARATVPHDAVTPRLQACFSPEGDRVVYADGHALHVVALGADARPAPPWTLDCGSVLDPAWLDDGSVLFARQSFWEVSTRLYRLADGHATRLRSLETRLIGGYTGLAASPDRSSLALVARVSTSNLYLTSGPDADPSERSTLFPALQPVWAPGGELVYSADTARALRLFVLDPLNGDDAALELDVAGLEGLWPDLQLDQPAFSQDGSRLVFRAKGEPLDDLCNPQTWIVISPWPPRAGAALAVPIGPRNISFPHVSDTGDRVTWNEGEELHGADVQGGRLVDADVRASGLSWPARLSGDGRRIAAPVLQGGEWRVVVLGWDGEVEARSAGPGNDHRPEWLPHEAGLPPRLSFLHWDQGAPDRWVVESLALDGASSTRELAAVPVPDEYPAYASYDPRGQRLAYTIVRDRGGDIWLVRPKKGKGMP